MALGIRSGILAAAIAPCNPFALDADVRGIDDLTFIDAMVERLHREYNIVRRRIYVTSFSLGVSLTHVIA